MRHTITGRGGPATRAGRLGGSDLQDPANRIDWRVESGRVCAVDGPRIPRSGGASRMPSRYAQPEAERRHRTREAAVAEPTPAATQP